MRVNSSEELLEFITKTSKEEFLYSVIATLTPRGIIIGFRDAIFPGDFDVAISESDPVSPEQFEDFIFSGKRVAYFRQQNVLRNPTVWFLSAA